MARNDQLTRQWHLLRRLEGVLGLTLRELADGRPGNFPKHLRTIRRDLEALEAAGYPLVVERTDGRTRWRLLEGARSVPAVGFSPTELMALAFSRALLKPLQGTYIRAALDSALAKVTVALSPSSLDFVRQMQGFLSVRFGPHKSYRKDRQIIDRLTGAVAERRTIQMRYFSAARGRTTRREMDPYHIWYAAGGLYLIGYGVTEGEAAVGAVETEDLLGLGPHAVAVRHEAELRLDLRQEGDRGGKAPPVPEQGDRLAHDVPGGPERRPGCCGLLDELAGPVVVHVAGIQGGVEERGVAE